MINRPHFQRLVEQARALSPLAGAVVYPCDRDSLQAAISAQFAGYLAPILIIQPWSAGVIVVEAVATHLLVRFFSDYASRAGPRRLGPWRAFFGRWFPAQPAKTAAPKSPPPPPKTAKPKKPLHYDY